MGALGIKCHQPAQRAKRIRARLKQPWSTVTKHKFQNGAFADETRGVEEGGGAQQLAEKTGHQWAIAHCRPMRHPAARSLARSSDGIEMDPPCRLLSFRAIRLLDGDRIVPARQPCDTFSPRGPWKGLDCRHRLPHIRQGRGGQSRA